MLKNKKKTQKCIKNTFCVLSIKRRKFKFEIDSTYPTLLC